MKLINWILSAIICFAPLELWLKVSVPIYKKAGLIPLTDDFTGVATCILAVLIWTYSYIIACKFYKWFKSQINCN